ncbi:MAG: hypothetical protein PF693_07455 [Spirochaetia bacterium]|jgi:hypothetical protein|nr:hypothetical protein [Spirochaetia bacterium]
MKKLIFLIIFNIAFYMYGIDDVPSSIELIIPPVVVEFEDSFEAVLELKVPDYNDIILPDFEISLPYPQEMTTPDIDFDLPLPDFVEYNFVEKSSFFSEGVLGIGNRNNIIGNISLFRLGQDLRFSLSFSHDGLDGFGTNPAGMGFFSRKEAFEGDFKNGDESFSITGSGSFMENEDGLQGQASSYTSVIHRLSTIDLGFSGSNKISWDGGLGFKLAGKTLTAEKPDTTEELLLSFNSMLSWQKKWFHISIDGKYVFGRLSWVSDENIFNSNLEMEFSLSSLDISTKAGVFWIPGLIPLFPFSLSLDGVFDGFLQYQSSGGYLVRNYSNYEVWNDFPLTEASNGIDKGWFWKGQIIIPYQYHSELGFRWNYSYWDNLISIDPSGFSSSSGLFGVMSSNRNYLDISPFMKVSLLSQWNLLFGWNGQILADKKVLEPVHSVYTEIIYNSENYGIYISGNYSMYPFILVPSFSVGINYTLTEGVVLSFEGEDVLSFFTEDRIRIGSYIEAGGTFSLLTKISL